MKIAILGGGGCFALNFAHACHADGIEHFGIGRSIRKPPAFWQVEHEYDYWNLHLVDRLPDVLRVLDAKRPDVIVNFAAQGEGAASFGANAPDFYRTNIWGLVTLSREIATRPYLKRFIQISTSELYGSVHEPAAESARIVPNSPYAISKYAFDRHMELMHKVGGFPMNIIRPSNCYTPGQQLYRVIPKSILCALKGEKLPLHGGGKSEKSYLHATDLSRAVLSVLDKGTIGALYNCGPLEPLSIRALVGYVASACGVKFTDLVEDAPERTGQDWKYWLDSSALRADTGWTPTVDLTSGLEEMVAWVRAYPELLSMSTEYEHRP